MSVFLPAKRDCPALLILFLWLCPTTFVRAEEQAHTEWQVMVIDGQRVGYGTTEFRRRGQVWFGKQTAKMKFQRYGEPIDLETELRTEELADGTLRSFRIEIRNRPHNPTVSEGTITGTRLDLKTSVNGRISRKQINVRPNLKSPLWQERLFLQKRIKPGLVLSFDSWAPELSKPNVLRYRVDGERGTEMFDGSRKRLFKVHVENSVAPTLRVRGYVDRQGRWLKSETEMFGKTLETYTVSETEALKEIAGAELDLALANVIIVKGLRDPHKLHEVTYRIHLEEGNPADYFPEGPQQSVQAVDANTILLTVRRIGLPPRSTVSRKPDARYLKATQFLQANDYEITRLARRATAGVTDPGQQALNMERTVFEKVRDKNFSSAMASAAEVAKHMEGDCTEHAMLLAAMLRAGRLPSRVCSGFVYANSIGGFTGHMWTEVWVRDRWYPLDATLGMGGVGAGHLKISDSAVDEDAPAPIVSFLPMMELLGQMTIEVERQR
jgi:hypothetical protein